MAESSEAALTRIQSAIAALETALADVNVEEYEIAGRRIRRAQFSTTLTTLYERERVLLRRVARQSSSPVRLGKIGLPGRTSR